MSKQWHVSKGGRQHGPFTSAQLKKLADSGQVSPEDLIWTEGLQDWIAASSMNGLFPATATPRPVSEAASIEACTPNNIEPLRGAALEREQNSAPAPSGRHKQRLGILIAAGLGMSATFLPWAHAPIIGSVYGTAGDGWITLVLFIPALAFTLRGDSQLPIRGGKRLGLAVPAVLAAFLGVWKIVSFNTTMSHAGSDNPFAKAVSMSVQIGFGLYLLVAAGISVALVAWLLDKSSKETSRNTTFNQIDRKSDVDRGLSGIEGEETDSQTTREILNHALLLFISHVQRCPKRWFALTTVVVFVGIVGVLLPCKDNSSQQKLSRVKGPGEDGLREMISYDNLKFVDDGYGCVKVFGDVINETSETIDVATFSAGAYDAQDVRIDSATVIVYHIPAGASRPFDASFCKSDVSRIHHCQLYLNGIYDE